MNTLVCLPFVPSPQGAVKVLISGALVGGLAGLKDLAARRSLALGLRRLTTARFLTYSRVGWYNQRKTGLDLP